MSLDDFGTGYSSLVHLRRLPVSELKIDRSFVARLAVDAEDAEIVRCTVDLAHSLGLLVVAEGVEDDETWERLRDLGCDAVQGWLVAAAMPPDETTAWLRARDGVPHSLERAGSGPQLERGPSHTQTARHSRTETGPHGAQPRFVGPAPRPRPSRPTARAALRAGSRSSDPQRFRAHGASPCAHVRKYPRGNAFRAASKHLDRLLRPLKSGSAPRPSAPRAEGRGGRPDEQTGERVMTTTAKRRLVATVSGLVLAAGTLVGGTASAAVPDRGEHGATAGNGGSRATSCYGGATSETFKMGTDEAPHGFGPYYMGTACGDINLKLTKWGSASTLRTKICFGGPSSSCDEGPALRKSDVGKWRVLATDVIPGTKYWIRLDLASHTFRGLLAD